jgi:hypothetical protein
MKQKTAAGTKPKQETPYQFNKRIGTTNYSVSVHFSKTSRENITDKITRLIKSETQAVN